MKKRDSYYDDPFLEQHSFKSPIITPNDIIVYKGTKAKMVCRGMQFSMGHTYQHTSQLPELCGYGFHSCRFPVDTMKYYEFSKNHRYFQCVIPAGSHVHIGNDKIASSHIRFEQELTAQDIIQLCINHAPRGQARMTRSITKIIDSDPTAITCKQFKKLFKRLENRDSLAVIRTLISNPQFIDSVDLPKMWETVDCDDCIELLTAYPHLCDTVPSKVWDAWPAWILCELAKHTSLCWQYIFPRVDGEQAYMYHNGYRRV